MPLSRPTVVDFGKDGNKALDTWLHNMLEGQISGLKNLHEQKKEEWDKLIRGIPKEDTKNFPWKNASNLVVQIVGTHVDSLRARVLGNIFNVMPLYVCQLIGDWNKEEQGEEQREIVEQYMNYVGMEPTELDLYRILSSGIGDTISYGTGFWKTPWETLIEECYAGTHPTSIVKFDGPKPFKVPFDRIGATVTANTVEEAEFVYHKITLRRHHLEERAFKGIYDKTAVEKIYKQPSRMAPQQSLDTRVQNTATEVAVGDTRAEWDIYECHFRYWHNGKAYRIIYTYHLETKTKLKAIFNWMPQNEGIFTSARLGYDGMEGLYGYGFAEMLRHYQEEVSTMHNQRGDNNTLANTNIFRFGGNSKLDSIFKLYPGAGIPAEKDEFEIMPVGRAMPESVQYEQHTLGLAKERSGVEPPTTGTGGGIQNPRKGIYSAMGTFSVLQQGNGRVNINTTDMRYAHIKLGRLFLLMYAHFGIGDRAKIFGEKAQVLTKALENYKNRRIAIPIKAANASVNREIEKQNDMLLMNVTKQHYMSIAEIMKAVMQPTIPPPIQEYLIGVIEGSNHLMKHIMRNFGHDDVSRLVPEPNLKGGLNAGGQGQQPTAGSGQGDGAIGNPSIQQVPSEPQVIGPGII